jgi:hypothetical protein
MYVRFPEFLLKVAVPLPARAGHTMNVRFFALAVPERIVANPPFCDVQTDRRKWPLCSPSRKARDEAR